MSVSEIAEFLETPTGKDKMIRTLCYAAKLTSALVKSESASEKLNSFGSQLSNCRVILRLFDDFPQLSCTLEYGLGAQERDVYLRFFNVLRNLVDQAFFPIEHIEWLADNNYINVRSEPWAVCSTWCWVISLALSLMKSLRTIKNMNKRKKSLKEVDSEHKDAVVMAAKRRREVLSAVRNVIDLIHAIHCLPPGFLWSSHLSRLQVGTVGTLSSLLGLYMAVTSFRANRA
ncbi:peroxisomal membrane protein 11C-like [Schistocerca serialis cubense]|uniref:peroxisomal membrane protein 11C-like n=1 Tax=Schistocerca serialis cubense TaxID=2023355 RepID=UPI00214F38AD|nr:peroxisomal membrane protein 11C-like [Schistocerca serialis cubense]